jgi:8-oxo-dGTP diphosphatase
MKRFYDVHGNVVEFSNEQVFGESYHVLVICQYKEQWVLTKHKTRGLEFPGGKREIGETIEETAVREVLEETGGKLASLLFLGQYRVYDSIKPFNKSIFYAHIKEMQTKADYMETEGPVILKDLPPNMKSRPDFSFIMKDKVLPLSLERLQKLQGYESLQF